MAQVGRPGPKVGSHLGAALHPLREPGELSQWLSHDDSTIKIVLGIIIIIIIFIIIIINVQARTSIERTSIEHTSALWSTRNIKRGTFQVYIIISAQILTFRHIKISTNYKKNFSPKEGVDRHKGPRNSI